MWRYNYTNELHHYGVKGMKWGVRKAQKLTAKAEVLRKKGKDDKAERLEKKAEIVKKEEAFRDSRFDFNKSRSFGARLVTNLYLGPFANMTYSSVVASGGSRAKAIGVTAASTLVGGPMGNALVSHLYTKDAGRK